MGKLVRDKIPDLIRASGRRPCVTTLSEDSYRCALMDKLREEVAELIAARTRDSTLEEAADVLEILAAIASEQGATVDTIGEIARTKREQRGGFAMRLWLDTDDPGSARS